MCDIFKKEFKLRNFGLRHLSKRDFIVSQWRWHPAVFLTYRLLIAAYTTVFILVFCILLARDGVDNFMAYLTVWTYLMLTLYFLLSAVIAVFHTYRGEWRNTDEETAISSTSIQPRYENGITNATYSFDSKNHTELFSSNSEKAGNNIADGEGFMHSKTLENGTIVTDVKTNERSDFPNALLKKGPDEDITWAMKTAWVLGNVVQAFAVVVTAVYFTALYPAIGHTNFVDINLHAANSLFVIIDTCISARPVRLLHVVHPMFYGLIYVIFSAIYWSFDHKNNVLYPGVLDWNYVGMTFIWIAGLSLVVMPVLQLIYFGGYHLKIHCSKR